MENTKASRSRAAKKNKWKTVPEIMSEYKEKKKQREEGMSVMDHLTELRSRLFVTVFMFLFLSFAAFAFVRSITDEFLGMGLDAGFSFVYIAPSEVLVADFRVALICALVTDLPLILYEIWAYTAPALTKKEKLVAAICLAAGLAFFAAGCVFCYMIAMPMMVKFLSGYNTSAIVTSSISFQSYLNFVISMVLTFGVVFEMPIVSMLLSQFGILKPKFLKRVRKYAILVIFVIAAVITPPDVVSQVMIALPMLLLYEISIAVCSITYRSKREKELSEYGEVDDDSGKG